jgi:uncharacterized membrane protein YqhA
MHIEVKYLALILSIILILGGLYFKFLYDVPDGQEQTNMWVSVTLVILGVSGMALSSLWRKKNPLEVQKDLDYHEDARDVEDLK